MASLMRGDEVDGSGVEEETGAGLTIFPYGQGCLEMGGFDEGAAIECGVDGTEAENLGFGTAGGGSVQAGAALAKVRIAFMPELACVGAADEDFALTLRPAEGALQLMGYPGKPLRCEAAATRQGLTATHVGPEATVGKAVVRLAASEVLGELPGRDIGDHAEVRVGGAEEMGSVVSVKVATIPGGAEQRGELAGIVAEKMEDGGELFGKEEEAAIGGWSLIAQGMENAVGSGAGGSYTARHPAGVGFIEQGRDLTPAASFAGLAGLADQYDEEIEAVTGGAGHAVRRRADHVAEGGEELQKDGCGIGFGVRRETADRKAGHAVEGGFGEGGQHRRGKRRAEVLTGVGCLGCFWVFGETGLFLPAGVFGSGSF